MSERTTLAAATDAELITLCVRSGLVAGNVADAALDRHGDATAALIDLVRNGALDRTRLAELRVHASSRAGSVPRRIGAYAVIDTLGTGGMGVVYRVVDEDGEHLALKVLSPAMASDEDLRARFTRETRALLAISSPHVVAIRGIGEDDGRPYVVMELLRGGSAAALADRAGGKLEPTLAARICRDAACGLEAIAAAGLIHRDVKPENIFLDEHGLAKLGDLGVVRTSAPGQARLTSDGRAVGTPAFMAPEQARAEPDVDIRADVYALGSTLYCLLVGRPAFTGSSAWCVMSQTLAKPLPDPGDELPSCPPALRAVVLRAGAIDRRSRYPGPRELREDFDRYLAGDALPPPVAAAPRRRTAPQACAGQRLLLVDDDPMILRLHAAALNARGFTVDTATSGVEALARCAVVTPDALLVDLMMEGMDGAELIRQFRARTATRSTPVIVLSNAFFDDELRAAREAGANLELSKASHPPADMAQAVERFLGGRVLAAAAQPPVSEGVLASALGEAIDRCRSALQSAAQSADILGAGLDGLATDLRRASALAAGTAPLAASLLAASEALCRQLLAWPDHFNRSTRGTLDGAGLVLTRRSLHDASFPPSAPAVVVDDDPVSRSVMRMSMRRLGLAAEAFPDARSALAWLADHPACLVLSDVMMDDMNGIELAAAVRRLNPDASPPVILVTSLTGFDVLFAASGDGASAVIAKPFLPLELGVKALTLLAR